VRERRLWVWLTDTEERNGMGAQASMALSSNRQTLDVDREFNLLKTRLMGATPS
jgi:cytochrome c biogenesis protein